MATAAPTASTASAPSTAAKNDTPKPKKVKVAYRKEGSAKLTDLPTDFKPSVHKPLTKDDFEKESTYCRWQASRAQAKADRWLQQAEDFDKFGSAKEKKAAEQLAKLRKSLDDKKKALIESLGEDTVNEMLAKIEGTTESK